MQKHHPRMFIGLDLAPKNKLDIEHWREKNLKTSSGTFVPAENFHITLSFLGQLPPEKMESLHAMLMGIASENLTLTTTQLGYFQKPKVLYLGIENCDAINALAKQCLSINNKLGLPQPHSTYRPHITLMRKHKEAMPILANPPKLTMTFEQFHLFESVSSTKKGVPPHYPKRLSFNLTPKLSITR